MSRKKVAKYIAFIFIIGMLLSLMSRNSMLTTEQVLHSIYGDRFYVDNNGDFIYQTDIMVRSGKPLIITLEGTPEESIYCDLPFGLELIDICVIDRTDELRGKQKAVFQIINHGSTLLTTDGSLYIEQKINGKWYRCMGVGATAGIKHLEPGESMQIGAVLAYRDTFNSFVPGHYRAVKKIYSNKYIICEFELRSMGS